jgi:hypothetical protein
MHLENIGGYPFFLFVHASGKKKMAADERR